MKKVILGAVLFPLSGPVLSSSLQDQLANFFRRSWFGAKSGHYGAGAEY